MNDETRALLKQRATAMAKEPEHKLQETELIELVVFTLAAEDYGIESVYIREIYPLKDFTPLPGVPSYILGIINVRGQILPVVDLKKFLNLPGKGLGELNKVIILHNEQMEFGILADVVQGTQSVPIDSIQVLISGISGLERKYLKGVTSGHLIILDAKEILEDDNISVYQESE